MFGFRTVQGESRRSPETSREQALRRPAFTADAALVGVTTGRELPVFRKGLRLPGPAVEPEGIRRDRGRCWVILPQVSCARVSLRSVLSLPRAERLVVHTCEEESMSLQAQTRFPF
jgi:hypothetical protein